MLFPLTFSLVRTRKAPYLSDPAGPPAMGLSPTCLFQTLLPRAALPYLLTVL